MSKVFLLPISVYVLFQVTFIVTYIASILENHVVPTVPFISDAATNPPESCIFSQLINTTCVLLGVTIYVRYRQILHITDHHEVLIGQITKLNKWSLYTGWMSAYGISIVANFQVTNLKPMHYVGAFACFGVGTAYLWQQTVLTMKIESYITLKKARLRIILSLFCSIFFVTTIVCGIISKVLFRGKDPRHWYPSDGGFRYHVASTVSEWVLATIFSFFILSFTDEFKYVQFEHPAISFMIIEIENTDTQNLIEEEDASNEVEA